MKAALVSGGKDSFYAVMLEWPVDLAVVLVYEFPRPSPHLVNLGKAVETLGLAGLPVVVARLPRGGERGATVELLRLLGVDRVVAGDVYVYDHLHYMESVAADAGAELREPLWGMDPLELLYREAEAGIESVVIGAEPRMEPWIGRVFSADTVEMLAAHALGHGVDPLGERGEYHSLVTRSPLHSSPLGYEARGVRRYPGYAVLELG